VNDADIDILRGGHFSPPVFTCGAKKGGVTRQKEYDGYRAVRMERVDLLDVVSCLRIGWREDAMVFLAYPEKAVILSGSPKCYGMDELFLGDNAPIN
jgi:hypothetical protein